LPAFALASLIEGDAGRRDHQCSRRDFLLKVLCELFGLRQVQRHISRDAGSFDGNMNGRRPSCASGHFRQQLPYLKFRGEYETPFSRCRNCACLDFGPSGNFRPIFWGWELLKIQTRARSRQCDRRDISHSRYLRVKLHHVSRSEECLRRTQCAADVSCRPRPWSREQDHQRASHAAHAGCI
jgi:hypothetical protein